MHAARNSLGCPTNKLAHTCIQLDKKKVALHAEQPSVYFIRMNSELVVFVVTIAFVGIGITIAFQPFFILLQRTHTHTH